VLLLPISWLTGCHSEAHQHAAPPPQVVVVSQPLEREVTDFSDFTGRTDAVQSVDIRARVTGYLTKMPFKEGDEVKKGALLFEIDPRPYQAAADQAKANVLSNQAQVNLAAITYARYQKLAQTPNAVSQQDLDQYRTNVDSAKAAMLAAEAAQRTADLNLEFTRVTSPVDGQVSRYYLTLGNLATQDQTLLTTVVSLDPMYAYFDVDESTVLNIRREINAGRIKPRTERSAIPVLMGLQGEQGFPHEGLLDFVNNKIDPSTGTMLVRGTFSNPKPEHGARLLSPGMFVRIRLPIGPPHQAQLVADEAVGTDQGLKFLYVVNDQNKVEYRTVKLGALQEDGLRVVEPGSKPGEGIKPGEWVVTAGVQLIQQGMTVNPERKPMQIPAPEQDQSPKKATAPADAPAPADAEPKPVQPRS
jgi:multidrug efflux system membrane fusion protein